MYISGYEVISDIDDNLILRRVVFNLSHTSYTEEGKFVIYTDKNTSFVYMSDEYYPHLGDIIYRALDKGTSQVKLIDGVFVRMYRDSAEYTYHNKPLDEVLTQKTVQDLLTGEYNRKRGS